MIIIKIILIILIILAILSLFYPLIKKEQQQYNIKGITHLKELEIEKNYLERQLQDLSLDKDSGKISEEEWDNLIKPIREKIIEIEKKIKT